MSPKAGLQTLAPYEDNTNDADYWNKETTRWQLFKALNATSACLYKFCACWNEVYLSIL